MIHNSVLDFVGHTPIVRLQRISVGNGSEILVKLESCNPARSIKDRAALFMIEQAEQRGELSQNGTIIESTSGNVGKALALIGAVRGYRVVLVVDPKVPRSMIEFVTALGAEIVMVDVPDADGGYQGPRIERVRSLLDEDPDMFWPDQYNNPDNPRAHAERTAHEILDDIPDLDVLVTTVSTGGHISGLSKTLKSWLPELVTVAVDASGSAAFGYPFSKYVMRGLGLAWKPGNLNRSLIDRVHLVADHEGITTSHMLARYEGMLVGESSGAAVFGALHHAHQNPGKRILVIAADDGVNYLRESFDKEWLRARGIEQVLDEYGIGDHKQLLEASYNPAHPAVPLIEGITNSDQEPRDGAYPAQKATTG
jgi:2,3-diaminopropionate biosynthesis protein SbnA